jgi:hypothetical protein
MSKNALKTSRPRKPSNEWKLPLAMAVTVLISSYLIHVQTMWRQAPITAALIIATSLTHESRLTGVENGLHKVAEVVLGCVTGVAVSWLMSELWPLREAKSSA